MIKMRDNNKIYAGKFISDSEETMSSEESFFYRRELKILQDIQHPFCLKFVEELKHKEDDQTKLFFVTEYCNLGTLDELIWG